MEKTGKRALLVLLLWKTELIAVTATKFQSFHPLEISGLIHKCPGYGLSPSGIRPLFTVLWNVFRPGGPRTSPNRVFALKTPQSYGKRVTWVHSAQPACHSFWQSIKKSVSHFGPQGPKKWPRRPVSGHQLEKKQSTPATAPKFRWFHPFDFSD